MKVLKCGAVAIAAAGLVAMPVGAQEAPPITSSTPAHVEAQAAPAPAPAPAEQVPAAEPAVLAAPLPSCELHVFPTLEGQALTTSLLSGFGMIGAIADAAANKNRNISETEYLKEALGPRLQVEAMQGIDLLGAFKLPPSQVIFETPIADRKITTKAATRLGTSTAPCYVELIVTQNFYTKKAIYGRSLNNRFVFKDFRNGRTSAKLVKGRGGNGLSHFPPKTTDETEAAERELREVFAKNLLEFANGRTAR